MTPLNDIARWAGLTNPSGPWYLFWSGSGADGTYLTVLVAVWRHLECHEPYCHRPGRHHVTVEGVMHRSCRHHIRSVHGRATEAMSTLKGHL